MNIDVISMYLINGTYIAAETIFEAINIYSSYSGGKPRIEEIKFVGIAYCDANREKNKTLPEGVLNINELEQPVVEELERTINIADSERACIDRALEEANGNKKRAAELLGISERTLYRKIKDYNL